MIFFFYDLSVVVDNVTLQSQVVLNSTNSVCFSREFPVSLPNCVTRTQAYRSFASDAPRSGGGFMQRISSFLVGAGLTALVTQFYILQEIRDGNKSMIEKQKDLEKRLKKLEG